MQKLSQTLAAVAVASMLSAGSTAWALQEPVPQPEPERHEAVQPQTSTATGELHHVDTDAMTLTVKSAGGETWTFRYTDQTEISGAQDASPASPRRTGRL